MLGHSHALSGVVSGAAVGELVFHASVANTAYLAALTAGFAVLPDIDHCGTSVSRSFGFLSEWFAWVVSKLSGGHRHGTHSIVGIAFFTALVWLASEYRQYVPVRVALGVFLALAIAAGLRALRIGGHFGDLIAIAGAAAIAYSGYGLDASWVRFGVGLALVPVACAIGCATHIVGDMLTEEGCPLLWPATKFYFKWWPRPLAFRTGTKPEMWGVVPVLTIALCWLGYLAWHSTVVR